MSESESEPSGSASEISGGEGSADITTPDDGASPSPDRHTAVDESATNSEDTPIPSREDAPNDSPATAPTGRGRRVGSWVMLVAGVLILGGTAWVGWRTYQAYSHLKNASAAVSQLQDQLKDVSAIDTAATAATVAQLQSESADARAAVDDPVYRAATVLPWLGPNLAAIREVTLPWSPLPRSAATDQAADPVKSG